MELIVRLTRAGLVALGACAAGVALFDKLAPSGEIRITDPSALSEALAIVPNDYRAWLGPLAVVSGSGAGYGFGYGAAFADGDGAGFGDGAGAGDGYGDAFVSGAAFADGDGAGFGDGDAFADGDGDGSVPS